MSGFPTGATPAPGLRRDPEWFKTAVFYELLAGSPDEGGARLRAAEAEGVTS